MGQQRVPTTGEKFELGSIGRIDAGVAHTGARRDRQRDGCGKTNAIPKTAFRQGLRTALKKTAQESPSKRSQAANAGWLTKKNTL